MADADLRAGTGGGADTCADWLALHGVSADQLRGFLDRAGIAAGQPPDTEALHGTPDLTLPTLTPQAAWVLCADALRAGLAPVLHAAVAHVHQNTTVVLGPLPAGGPQALTVRVPVAQGGHMTKVYCPFDGQIADLLVMVHEFGHAVQLAACGDMAPVPMPPALREVCALAAEDMLLAYLDSGGVPQGDGTQDGRTQDDGAQNLGPLDPQMLRGIYPALKRVQARSRAAAQRGPLQGLRAALDHPQTPYDYSWNYPVAGAVCTIPPAPAQLAQVFHGTQSLADLIPA